MNEKTKHTQCRQMKTRSRHDADRWRHGANTMQTHNTHIMHFLNCEDATKKIISTHKSISWQGVYSLNFSVLSIKSIVYLLTHHFLNTGGETIIGCPVTQLVGLTIHPHYRYLSPIIIFKKVPLYDVPWDICSTVGLTQYP